ALRRYNRGPVSGSQGSYALGWQRDGDESRKNHERGEKHFGERGDQRRSPRRAHRIRSHGALDNQEVRTPVAKGENEPESHRQTEPFNTHAAGVRIAHSGPGVRIFGSKPGFQSFPTAHVPQSQPDQWQEPSDDEKKLEDFVVDGAGKAS